MEPCCPSVCMQSCPPIDQLPSPADQLHHITIDDSDVYEALGALDPTKAPGTGNISPYILKLCVFPC